jgi:L-lactate dehydrogenase complex protein LldF
MHKLMLFNRRDAVEKGYTEKSFSMVMKAYKKVMNNRWMIETFPPAVKNIGVKMVFKKAWGPRRELPRFKESFHSLWKKEEKGKL